MPIVKPCASRGCRALIPLGNRHCPEHAQQEQRRKHAKQRAYGYQSPHWQKVRRQRLELAGYVCELRINCDGDPATHVHLDPAYRGQHRAANVEDCRACCASCSGAIDAPRAHGHR